MKIAEKTLDLTGYEDLSLLSLSSGDYSHIGSLLRALMDRHSPDHIGISLPSLRVDSLDAEMMAQIKGFENRVYSCPRGGKQSS